MTTEQNRPTSLRTHLCGVLRADDVGTTVTLCGWVARRREHGEHLAFVDLRDHSGIIQCVVDGSVDVRSEWVIAVTGTVRHRPEGTVNPGIETGEVEIGDCVVEVLNEAEPPPFPVDDRAEADEAVRLKYRYVDLRRPRMQRNLRLQGAGQRGAAGGHGPAGVRGDRDADPVGADAGGLARVLRAVAAAPRQLLRVAPEPAAGQAAAHGRGLRPLLPDRPLPARRGPARRPPVRVHAARYGVLLRLPGRRHGLRQRGRPRRGGGRHRRAAPAN